MVSFVRSTENANQCNSSLLSNWQRINVALTRAKVNTFINRAIDETMARDNAHEGELLDIAVDLEEENENGEP